MLISHSVSDLGEGMGVDKNTYFSSKICLGVLAVKHEQTHAVNEDVQAHYWS